MAQFIGCMDAGWHVSVLGAWLACFAHGQDEDTERLGSHSTATALTHGRTCQFHTGCLPDWVAMRVAVLPQCGPHLSTTNTFSGPGKSMERRTSFTVPRGWAAGRAGLRACSLAARRRYSCRHACKPRQEGWKLEASGGGRV